MLFVEGLMVDSERVVLWEQWAEGTLEVAQVVRGPPNLPRRRVHFAPRHLRADRTHPKQTDRHVCHPYEVPGQLMSNHHHPVCPL